MAQKRLTSKQREILRRMESGETLCIQKAEPPYFFDGDNPVNQRTVRALEAAGKILRSGDGFFGDSQTFRLA